MTIVMNTISKSQLKSQLLEYLRKVEQEKKPLIVTHGGKPVITVSPYYEDPQKTLSALRNSVVTYINPLAPVAEDEWEALQ